MNRILLWMICVVIVVCQSSVTCADEPKPLRVMQTPQGNTFGLYGEKPTSPAPTLFILASGIEVMRRDSKRMYSAAGDELAKSGWLAIALDPPCHGSDEQQGEPAGLSGWAHRVANGKNLMGPFVKKCSDVLDYLIDEGYSDANRIAASGTSRGGFCALHFAAHDARIRVVTAVSPVTHPLTLTEFAGVTEEQIKSIDIGLRTDSLVGRPILLTIGNDDARVGTDKCIQLVQKLVAANRRLKPDQKRIPVELIVGSSIGHYAIEDAYALEAKFLLKQFSDQK